jgi:hypothetical protein
MGWPHQSGCPQSNAPGPGPQSSQLASNGIGYLLRLSYGHCRLTHAYNVDSQFSCFDGNLKGR